MCVSHLIGLKLGCCHVIGCSLMGVYTPDIFQNCQSKLPVGQNTLEVFTSKMYFTLSKYLYVDITTFQVVIIDFLLVAKKWMYLHMYFFIQTFYFVHLIIHFDSCLWPHQDCIHFQYWCPTFIQIPIFIVIPIFNYLFAFIFILSFKFITVLIFNPVFF